MNPCPCGYFQVPDRICTCQDRKVHEYHARMSGPLLDRIDITLQTKPVEYRQIAAVESQDPTSAHYRARVEAARDRQLHRFRLEEGVFCNAQMGPRLLRRHCAMSARAERFLEMAVRRHALSARAHDRILKIARTRADLEGHARIEDDRHEPRDRHADVRPPQLAHRDRARPPLRGGARAGRPAKAHGCRGGDAGCSAGELRYRGSTSASSGWCRCGGAPVMSRAPFSQVTNE